MKPKAVRMYDVHELFNRAKSRFCVENPESRATDEAVVKASLEEYASKCRDNKSE